MSAAEARVACAVVRARGRVLVVRRDESDLPAGWGLPCAAAEGDTAAQDALSPMLEALLGGPCSSAWPLDDVEGMAGEKSVRLECVAFDAPRDLVPADGEGVRWVAPEDLLDVEWSPLERELVMRLAMGWSEIFSENRF